MFLGVHKAFILCGLSLLYTNCAQKRIDPPPTSSSTGLARSFSLTDTSTPSPKELLTASSGKLNEVGNALIETDIADGLISSSEERKYLKGTKKKGREIAGPQESVVPERKKTSLRKQESIVHTFPEIKLKIPATDSSAQVDKNISSFLDASTISLKPKSKKQGLPVPENFDNDNKQTIPEKKRKSSNQKNKKKFLSPPSKSQDQPIHSQKKELPEKRENGQKGSPPSVSLIKSKPHQGEKGESKQIGTKPNHALPFAGTQKLGKQFKGVVAPVTNLEHSISFLQSGNRSASVEEITGGEQNAGFQDEHAELNFTERAGVVLGWKAELLRSEEVTRAKFKTENQSIPTSKGSASDFRKAKIFLNRQPKTSKIKVEHKGNLNSLQKAEDWNQGRGGKTINLSEQNLDDRRFEEALRWIQQKGK